MPIERYKVGRKYTERLQTSADFTDPEAVREVMSALAASDHTVEARLADAERRATAHLKRIKMPLDPNACPYGDPTWLRENERKSLDWYAINILNTIRMLRNQIKRGDVELAVDLALDLGVLATEASMIQYIAGNTGRGGEGFKTSDMHSDIVRRHEAWCAEADKLWKAPRQKWGTLAIAKLIDPSRFETIRKVIKNRKPR
jgi:hypothetical protein